ncbi:hypothetical protein AOG28_15800 [Cobetia sp. UCD-24C]|nr:hypothetical protein AOG28_15800 [Cobetia sp. UCD-24C]
MFMPVSYLNLLVKILHLQLLLSAILQIKQAKNQCLFCRQIIILATLPLFVIKLKKSLLMMQSKILSSCLVSLLNIPLLSMVTFNHK